MSNLKRKKGFTLVELLIAVAVFAIFLTSIVTLLVDMYRSARRITLEEQIYQDLRAMLRQVTVMVENNAIDYEEYYRAASGSTEYGEDSNPANYQYGDYAKLFYDVGSDNDFGVLCNDGTEYDPAATCDVIDKTTLDTNMGKNPPLESLGDPADANAFCGGDIAGVSSCPPPLYQDELYLINKRGDRKRFLALEPIEKDVDGTIYDENVLSTLWMNGTDTDGDDVSDDWTVAPEFDYNGVPGTLAADLATPKPDANVFEEFIPVSPMRTNIIDMQFYVAPYEDPYKAYAESGILVQPHVTVVITVEPSASELTNYLGPVPRKTLQTTIYSEVRENVESY